ncbi:MAG: hypothetical protein J2P54_12775 [Bradyrhizobiaceae bacterium]|nr:hypothetical protein [Bradyrhizobiaceae bacterium]
MKGGKEHNVPLSKPELGVIDAMRAVRQNGFVLPGDTGDQPMSDVTLTEVIRRWNLARKKANDNTRFASYAESTVFSGAVA